MPAPDAAAAEPLPPGPTARQLDPVPGRLLDPPDVDTAAIRRVVDRSDTAAFTWRWWERYRDGHGMLSATGMACYGLFSLLSALVLTYGVLLVQVPQLKPLVSLFLRDAFPGLIGPAGIDPALLADAAGTVNVISAAALAYSALAVMRAIDGGVRLVYGVQFDPRGIVVKTIRHLGWALLLLPLFMASYVGSTITSGVLNDVFAFLGLDGVGIRALIRGVSLVVSLTLNAVLLWLVLSRLTGVCPPNRPRIIGAVVGSAALEAVKISSAVIVGVVLANPRNAVVGTPIALLLLLLVMATVVLVAAALTATLSEGDPRAAARRRQQLQPGPTGP
jgi:uncharacterized BrkB/YihY/UPF0761 family membrane protein